MCAFVNTYEVVHGEGDVVQNLHQKLLSDEGCDVSVPFCKPFTTEHRKEDTNKRLNQIKGIHIARAYEITLFLRRVRHLV